MEVYQRLITSIENKQGVAFVTITRVNGNLIERPQYAHLIGWKFLVWLNGQTDSDEEWPTEVIGPMKKVAIQALNKQKSRTYLLELDQVEFEYFVEVYPSPLHLVIAGAGHVAKPVAKIAKILGFQVTVVCDRIKFANREEFPWVDQVICMQYLEYFRELEITPSTYVLLLTRGHKYDVLILRELLQRSAKCYIGMIGSRRRISGVFSQLHKDFPEENFENIYAPLGLDIGAQTPEEIAISTLAEILKVKNNCSGNSLSQQVGHFIVEEAEENDRTGILV